MKGKNIVLGAIVGAAAGAAIATFLNTEKGKQFLSQASGALKNEFVDKASSTLKGIAGKTADVAKTALQTSESPTPSPA